MLKKYELPPLVERWLSYLDHNRGHSPSTCRSYQRYMCWFWRYLNGKDLAAVTLRDLEEFSGMHLHRLGMSLNTRRVIVAILRGFFGWAHKVGELPANHAAGLESIKIGRKLPPLMGLENAQKLLNAPDIGTFRGLRDCAMFHVLLGSGCRVSGLVRLNQSSLNWYHDDAGRERLAIKFQEKGKVERLVPCPMEVGLMIRAYLGHEYLDTVDRTVGRDGDQVLFINIGNIVHACDRFGEARRLTVAGVQVIMKRYCEKVGIPKEFWHPHALRHLYATELHEGGADLHDIAALLGHKNIETTKIYTHLAYRRLSTLVDNSSPMSRVKGPVSELKSRVDVPLSR